MSIYDRDSYQSGFLKSLYSPKTSPPETRAPGASDLTGRLEKLMKRIEKGNYQAALTQLGQLPQDAVAANIRGVLLLRLNQAAQALPVFRNLALDSSIRMVRKEIPLHVGLNYATSLLMTGRVAGCLDVIRELPVPVENEQAELIRLNIRHWESTLSWWRKLDWKCCRIEHLTGEFPLDHIPGRFGWEAPTGPASAMPDHRHTPPLAPELAT